MPNRLMCGSCQPPDTVKCSHLSRSSWKWKITFLTTYILPNTQKQTQKSLLPKYKCNICLKSQVIYSPPDHPVPTYRLQSTLKRFHNENIKIKKHAQPTNASIPQQVTKILFSLGIQWKFLDRKWNMTLTVNSKQQEFCFVDTRFQWDI